jgi:hypothetical protein
MIQEHEQTIKEKRTEFSRFQTEHAMSITKTTGEHLNLITNIKEDHSQAILKLKEEHRANAEEINKKNEMEMQSRISLMTEEHVGNLN